MCEITDEVLARFVTGTATMKEGMAVLEACKTDLEVANQVIMGFLVIRVLDKAIEELTPGELLDFSKVFPGLSRV